MDKLYAIPVEFIEAYGASAGYCLAKLSHLQAGAKREVDGKKWFYCPLSRRATGKKADSEHYRPLSDHFPWISSASGLLSILTKLERKKALFIGRKMNHRGFKVRGLDFYVADTTLHYSVPEAVCKVAHEKDRDAKQRFFDPDDAVKLGIVAALVLNLIYREFHLRGLKGHTCLHISRRAIAKDLRIPEATVRDAFNKLVEKKYLASCESSDGVSYNLLVANSCTMKGRGKGRRSISRPVQETATESTVVQFICASLIHANQQAKPAASCGSLSKLVENVQECMAARKEAPPKKRKRLKGSLSRPLKPRAIRKAEREEKYEKDVARMKDYAIAARDSEPHSVAANPMLAA